MSNFAYLRDGIVHYRLSAFGRCIREVTAARLGKEPAPLDEKSQVRLSQGELHERDVIERLTADGTPITDSQKEVRLELEEGAVIVGHLDGVYQPPIQPVDERDRIRGNAVFETKGLAAKECARIEKLGIIEWLQEHKQQAYLWQISGAMLATSLPAFYAIKNKESGEIMTAVIEEPFLALADFQARHAVIQSHVERGDLPECEKTGWCWNGPYRHLHYKKDEDEPVIDTRDEFLDELLADLRDVRSSLKESKDKEDWIKDTILKGWGVGKLRTDKFTVSITNHVRQQLNTRRLKERIGADEYEGLLEEISYTKIGQVKEVPRGESEVADG